MTKKFILLIVLALSLFALSACQSSSAPNVAEVPAGKAYANGETIYFTHTETSDKDVADLLTKMMKSPVVHVPSLAQAPDGMLTNVFVFKNGIAGSGPLKFQADVFENTPDDAGYTPLRRIVFVTWKNEGQAKELVRHQVEELHRLVFLRIHQPPAVDEVRSPGADHFIETGQGFRWHGQIGVENETAARVFFGGEQPIGRKVRLSGEGVEIVGVARDSKYRSVREETPRIAYFCSDQDERPGGERTVYIRTAGDPHQLAAAFRRQA